MSKVVSMRLKDAQVERLDRLAHHLEKPRSETVAQLIEEALRLEEFPYIDFRSTDKGRDVFLEGHRITVWELVRIARDFGEERADLAKVVADHLELPLPLIAGGLAYARAFPEEIEREIEAHDYSFEDLKRMLPNLEVFEFHLPRAR